MSRIVRYLYFFLALFLPFGSINPFNISEIEGVSGEISEQLGFAPYVFAICGFLSLTDLRVIKLLKKFKRFFVLLFCFTLTIIIASAVYKGNREFPVTYIIKLFVVELSFCFAAAYFIAHPKVLSQSLKIYAYTCSLIVLGYFLGLLDGFYFVSNGRLWIFGINPNSFSFLMGMGALIIANRFNHTDTSSSFFFLNVACVVMILLYIVLSGSRGTFLTVLACMVIILHKKFFANLYISIPLLMLSVYVGTSYYSSHQGTISIFERLTDSGSDERTVLITQSLDLFVEKPYIGYGVNGYKEQMKDRYHEGRDAHNVIITSMAMSGVVGVTCLLSFLWLLFQAAWKKRKSNLLALVLFIDVFLMSMKTGGVLTFAMMWYCFAVVLALAWESYSVS